MSKNKIPTYRDRVGGRALEEPLTVGVPDRKENSHCQELRPHSHTCAGAIPCPSPHTPSNIPVYPGARRVGGQPYTIPFFGCWGPAKVETLVRGGIPATQELSCNPQIDSPSLANLSRDSIPTCPCGCTLMKFMQTTPVPPDIVRGRPCKIPPPLRSNNVDNGELSVSREPFCLCRGPRE